MTDLFISDLHLSAERPKVLSRFLAFLQARAAEADRLFILGDLFDVWIGDDDREPPIPLVLEALAGLAERNTRLLVMGGNRDFLIGEGFAAATGAELLADPCVMEIQGRPMLLMHGDQLCTDDVTYQQARAYLRNPATIAEFAARSLPERRLLASQYRSKSGEATSLKAADIMDVNRATVVEYLESYQVNYLVHGHTHRPGKHRVAWRRGTATRHVLPEWTESGGGYLAASDGKLTAGDC